MPDNKIYIGRRKGCGDIEVYAGDGHGNIEPLLPGPSQAVYNHSPDGFEWGYSGSGPSQLSLALLLDATGNDDLAMTYHQDFKACFVAGWREGYWAIEAETIRAWVEIREFGHGDEKKLGVVRCRRSG